MRKWPLAGVVGLCGSRWKTVIRVPSRSPWDSTFHLVLCAPRPRHKNVNATNSPQAGLGPRRPTGRQCCSSLADGNKTKSVLLHKFFYQTEISCFFFLVFFFCLNVFSSRGRVAPPAVPLSSEWDTGIPDVAPGVSSLFPVDGPWGLFPDLCCLLQLILQ